jgi:hypothetical protein
MTENELLRDCLERLNSSGIGYFVTGSMASNYWGVPRTTHDLDFVVQLKSEQVSLLVAAFQKDFFIQESSVRGALGPPHQFNAIDQRSALKIDFWVLTGDEFAQQAFARRQQVSLFGTPAWIASAEDVLLYKLLWHQASLSERQLSDVAGIWALQEKTLDADYLQKWAHILNVAELLEKVQRGEIRPKNS